MWAPGATAVLAVTALIGLAPAVGSAATDTSPPLLNAPPFAKFVVGSQINTSNEIRANQKITWSASDPESGIYRIQVFDVWNSYSEIDRELIYSGVGNTITVADQDRCEGSEGVYQMYYEIVAENGAGLTTTTQVGGSVIGWNETGLWCWDYSSIPMAQSSGWSTSYFTGWFEGTTAKTTQKNAWTSYTLAHYRFRPGGHVALVMAKGPDRGKADIYLDGRLVKTVDTYSALKKHRVVVFDRAINTTGTHTLRIVNKATPGHPRIDIDAVMINSIRTDSDSQP